MSLLRITKMVRITGGDGLGLHRLDLGGGLGAWGVGAD